MTEITSSSSLDTPSPSRMCLENVIQCGRQSLKKQKPRRYNSIDSSGSNDTCTTSASTTMSSSSDYTDNYDYDYDDNERDIETTSLQEHDQENTSSIQPPTTIVTTAAPAATTTSLRKRRVRFARHAEQHLIPSHHDYDIDERYACWYQHEEYEDIHCDCRLQLYNDDDDDHQEEEDEQELRGLEMQSRIGQETKLLNRLDASDIVFGLQEEGWSEKIIAEEYAAVSSSCQLWAYIVGMKDERDAMLLQDDDDDMMVLCDIIIDIIDV